MIIRQYDPSTDLDPVSLLESEAFSSADNMFDEGDYYLDYLRSQEAYVPELELVAVENERIVGHILLTPHPLDTPAGPVGVLYLSPLSVVSDMQRRGIGSELVREALRISKDMGYPAVFLVGEPAFYTKVGFTPASEYGITSLEDVPDEVLLCYILNDQFENMIRP